jgi:hypothetical protein
MKDILKNFKMNDSRPLSTPMSATTALDADKDGEPVDQKEYVDGVFWYTKHVHYTLVWI